MEDIIHGPYRHETVQEHIGRFCSIFGLDQQTEIVDAGATESKTAITHHFCTIYGKPFKVVYIYSTEAYALIH